MLRGWLSQTSRLCHPLFLEALSSQQPSGVPARCSAQTLISLRRFSSEDSSDSSTSQSQPAAPSAPTSSPRGVQQWRQWVDAKIGEKLEGLADEGKTGSAQESPASAADTHGETLQPSHSEAAPSAPATGSVRPDQEVTPSGPSEGVVGVRDLLKSRRARAHRTIEQEIYDIVVPPPAPSLEETTAGDIQYKTLAQAKEAPRLFPGGSNRAEEVSPNRIHPYRLFWPGQLYTPQDLDPYAAKDAQFEIGPSRSQQKPITRAEVDAYADFRNPLFLSNFLSEAGKLVPRRRTKLQQKVHRHLCRQVKIARCMALLPPDGRIQPQPSRRRGPPHARGPPQRAQHGPPQGGPRQQQQQQR